MPKICKVWMKSELQFLRENYREHGAQWVADRLEGRTLNSVRIQAHYLNLAKPHERSSVAGRLLKEARRNGKEAVTVPAPAVVQLLPAVIEAEFIRPIPLSRLMSGRA